MIEGQRLKERSAASAAPTASVTRLLEVVANRCRGRTLVVGLGAEGLAERVRARGLECTLTTPDIGQAEDGRLISISRRYSTVVLMRALEYLPQETGDRIVQEVWERVRSGGRLIVVVPNGDCLSEPGEIRSLDRRKLKRLLRPLGRFQLIGEQPFRWLVAEVKRRRRDGPRRNAAKEERYRVTADLCRGRVIELGCGAGELTALIAERGCHAIGVDISEEKIRSARARHPGVEFIRSDVRDLELPDEGFDTVVLAEILEHLREGPGGEVLSRAARLLKPGGRLIVSVPNEDSIPHPNHVRQFDRRHLEELLRPWGEPRLVTDQPYKWLMMYVEKST